MENIVLKSTSKPEFVNHKIIVNNRNLIEISGITKMLSSNENLISMMIKNTKLNVIGNNLHIEKLDVENGILQASGTVNNIKYLGNEGIIKRIFKWKLLAYTFLLGLC